MLLMILLDTKRWVFFGELDHDLWIPTPACGIFRVSAMANL